MESIEIPSSVESIGSYAFASCGLKNITIPKTVISIGNGAFAGCDTLTTVIIEEGITSVGDSTFNNCTDLTDISIPNSVTSIGDSAFVRCSSLMGIVIPEKVTSIGRYAFYGCGLTSVIIPNLVESIGNEAFRQCINLTSITIGTGVKSIGSSAFGDCDALSGVYIQDVAKWCGISFERAFDNPLLKAHNLYLNGELVTDLDIPDIVASIGKGAFIGCTSIKTISIPSSVVSIGDDAFLRCTSLTTVVIPEGVESIGEMTFYGCTGLTSVTIPSSVTSMMSSSFGDCANLVITLYYNPNLKWNTSMIQYVGSYVREVIVPNGVTYINSSAFYNFKGLTSVVIPNTVTRIGAYAFYGCNNLAFVKIPSSVELIGDSAFGNVIYVEAESKQSRWATNWADIYAAVYWGINDTNFVEVDGVQYVIKDGSATLTRFIGNAKAFEIPSQVALGENVYRVTNIGGRAFFGCKDLSKITIVDSVEVIESRAFYGCSGISSIIIPDGVTHIGFSAFDECSSLESVSISDSVINIENNAFGGTPWYNNHQDGVIYVGKLLYIYKGTMPNDTEIEVTEGVKCINNYAFYNRSGLIAITIPNTVERIGWDSFDGCKNLLNIYFKGTQEQWDVITEYVRIPNDANVHFIGDV